METVLLPSSKESLFNNYVANHPRGDVLQTTNWGKLKEQSGWEYHPLVTMEKGVIQAAALLLVKKLPAVPFTVIYSPRGPLYSSTQALEHILQAGVEFAKTKTALVWKLDPAIELDYTNWQKLATTHKLRHQATGLDFEGVQPKFVMILALDSPLSQLLANMKSKTRYNIRYAKRRGVEIFSATEKSQMDIFYSLLQETAIRDGFTIRPPQYFHAMWDHLVRANLAKLFLAYYEETPLAGAILFRLNDKAWYVYGASSNENRNLQAAHLIQWEMIAWAKSQGCRTYDFRGVSGDLRPENPLYGLYRFKEGFGAELVEYAGEYDLPIFRGGYALWKQALKTHNWLRSRRKEA